MSRISRALSLDKRGVPGTFDQPSVKLPREPVRCTVQPRRAANSVLLTPRTLLLWLPAFLLGLLLCNAWKDYSAKREWTKELLVRTVD